MTTILTQGVTLIAPDENIAVSSENFVGLIRTMRTRCRRGSRGLGEAIIQASDFTDKGYTERAREVYESFIVKADSEFHAQIEKLFVEIVTQNRRTESILLHDQSPAG